VWRRVRLGAGLAAPWTGLVHLWVILGLSVAMQYLRADDYGVEVGGWLQGVPPSWLLMCATSGALAGGLALLGGRLWWPALAFGGLFTVWMGSGALSSWVLTGHVDPRSVQLALACGGLALGTAAARPAWSGWSIYVIGAAYVWLNLLALYRNYYSLGTELTVAGRWWTGNEFLPHVAEAPPGLPYPVSGLARIPALVRYLLESWRFGDLSFWLSPEGFYLPRGLTANGNLTANALILLAAYSVPFSLGRRGDAFAGGRLLWARLFLAAAVFLPGLFLLYAVAARTAFIALGASAIAVVLPLGWSRRRGMATVAAVAIPAAVGLPALVATLGGPDWSGRTCVWQSWWDAVAATWSWGLGPPGRFPVPCSYRAALGQLEWHPHNEILQAWSLGGLVGLLAAVGALMLIAWFAVRYSDRDDRVLLVVVVCCALLLGLEVVTSFFGESVALGVASLGSITARSLSLMEASRVEPQR
jgi:hypothetical protein